MFRFMLIAVVFVSLIVSIVFSMQSFTGYLISDQVNSNANLVALGSLVVGVFGSMLYISKFRGRH